MDRIDVCFRTEADTFNSWPTASYPEREMLMGHIRFPVGNVSFLQMPCKPAARYALFVYLGISVIGWLGVIGFLFGQGPPPQWIFSPHQLIAILVLGGLAGFVLQYMAVMLVINARMIGSRIVSTSGNFLFRCAVAFAGIVAFALTLYATVTGSVLAILFFPRWF